MLVAFYPQIKFVHIACVVLSGSLFALRGLLINQTHFGLPLDFVVIAGTCVVLAAFGVYCFRKIES